jgi:hypothetical protein
MMVRSPERLWLRCDHCGRDTAGWSLGRACSTPTAESKPASIACLPSTNIIHSAKVASFARRAAEFGVRSDAGETDMARVQHRRPMMVEDLPHRLRFMCPVGGEHCEAWLAAIAGASGHVHFESYMTHADRPGARAAFLSP